MMGFAKVRIRFYFSKTLSIWPEKIAEKTNIESLGIVR